MTIGNTLYSRDKRLYGTKSSNLASDAKLKYSELGKELNNTKAGGLLADSITITLTSPFNPITRMCDLFVGYTPQGTHNIFLLLYDFNVNDSLIEV